MAGNFGSMADLFRKQDFGTYTAAQHGTPSSSAGSAAPGSGSSSYVPGNVTGKYIQTPQAQAALGLLWPGLEQLGTSLSKGGSLYDVPNAPMPTEGWFSGLDSSIQSGLLEPYTLASKQLAEQLGGYGQLGSARGGVSGSGAAGLGRFWEDAAQGMGMQAWNMINPNQMAQYQAGVAARQLPWLTYPNLLGSAMPTPYIKQSSSGGGGKK